MDSSLNAQKVCDDTKHCQQSTVMILIRKKVLKSDRPREIINLFPKNMHRYSPIDPDVGLNLNLTTTNNSLSEINDN